ncbi:hypothetical protein CEE37_03345 [candidate division LCP-89 bacterium B3_LCP]|uniref:Phosphodiesterase n=1 Tax=candidate division LCP-89 bacterium B3_LCP TaxID=2012998 RepID=A0A532V318_UNCL8|nr:MAG: hypothetical protein CEE37_03345 [candidate division LCP-89 bacterium B3_LCP]
MTSSRMKLLILGLDGFDPDLFAIWKDHLPNLARLADNGFFARINSTTPPMTFPAWSTFLTGVNPGIHGIFDFTERKEDRLSVRFINATHRRVPSFLRVASEAGFCVGSVGIPTTYPPEPLNGFQISGFDSPLPSKADASYVYPQELAAKINRKAGGYHFGNFNESRIGPGWHRTVLKKLVQGLDRKKKLVELLLREFSLDCLVLHVGETDTVGHHFWSFNDPESPRYVHTDDKTLSNAIFTIYQKADELCGDVIAACNPEAVLVVSDHGMGGTSDRMLYLNKFLAQHNLLEFSAEDSRSHQMNHLKKLGMKWIPYHLQRHVFRIANGKIASRIESTQRFSGIDWSKTYAYSEELNYFPSICLNLQGREKYGIVPPAEFDQTIKRVKEILLNWEDPETGGKVVADVLRNENVYQGKETINAPDLLLTLNQPDGYNYALGRSTTKECTSPWRKLSPDEYIGYKGGTMNGSHRQKGVLLLNAGGADIPLREDISLQDVAPTALALLGLKVPEWMEGVNLFSETSPASGEIPKSESTKHYSPEQEQDLQDKLRQLGYL